MERKAKTAMRQMMSWVVIDCGISPAMGRGYRIRQRPRKSHVVVRIAAIEYTATCGINGEQSSAEISNRTHEGNT
jgi:hypothetical protein